MLIITCYQIVKLSYKMKVYYNYLPKQFSNTKEIEIIRNLVKLEDQAAEKKVINIDRDNRTFKIGVITAPTPLPLTCKFGGEL